MIKTQKVMLGVYCNYTEDNDIIKLTKDCSIVLQKGGRGIMSVDGDLYYRNNYDIRKAIANVDKSDNSNKALGLKVNHDEIIWAINNCDINYEIEKFGDGLYEIYRDEKLKYCYKTKEKSLSMKYFGFALEVHKDKCDISFSINVKLSTTEQWGDSFEKALSIGAKDCLDFFSHIESKISE